MSFWHCPKCWQGNCDCEIEPLTHRPGFIDEPDLILILEDLPAGSSEYAARFARLARRQLDEAVRSQLGRLV